MYNSEENTVLREVRNLLNTWDAAEREQLALTYVRIRERTSETYIEAHYDPEDWVRFTPEVVSYLEHAAKVFRKFVAVYGD